MWLPRPKLLVSALVLCALLRLSAATCLAGECDCCICLRTGTFCDANAVDRDFSDDGLTEIESGSFVHADHVITLDLSDNGDTQSLLLYNESFVGLTNLQRLDLSNNELRTLPDGVFEPLGNLRELDLSENKLTAESLTPAVFGGLVDLTTLLLSSNLLEIFPPNLLDVLPSLNNITLHPNPLNCSDDNITTLYRLVQVGVVFDGNTLRCENSTLVKDLDIEIEGLPTPTPTPLPSTSTTISTTRSVPILTTPTSTEAPPTTARATPTPIPTLVPSTSTSTTPEAPPTTAQATPTPTPTLPPAPLHCSTATVGNSKGFFDWPETSVGDSVTQSCPYGPSGQVAKRACMVSGRWGEVEAEGCASAPEATQRVVEISQLEVTPETSEADSAVLASLPPSQPLTLREVEIVTQKAMEIVQALQEGGGNIELVLDNTLTALDTILESSGSTILQAAQGNSSLPSTLRQLIDSILLAALDADLTELVLNHAHLAVGGQYLPETSEEGILAVVHVHQGEEGVEVEFGEEGEGDGADVEVVVEGTGGNITIQVTVYNDTNLFNTSECGSGGVNGNVVTPVISVMEEEEGEEEEEEEDVVLTYNGVLIADGDQAVCARWNNSLNCGSGGWQTEGCELLYSAGNTYMCRCHNRGTYTILDVPDQLVVVSTSDLHLIARVIFYIFTVLSLLLYLAFIFTILLNKYLRQLPTMQSLVNLALAQLLSFMTMAVSYEAANEDQEACYTMATLQHYLILVSLSSLCLYPIMVCVRVFRRLWYERTWLIAPFVTVCWVFPAIPVGAYGVLRYDDFSAEQPEICWLEAVIFPNYFTYVSSFVAATAVLVALGSMVVLACSDYKIESVTYLQLASVLLAILLYIGAVVTQFFTPNSSANPDHLLMVIGGMVFICSVYFFIVNGLAKSRVRSALMCREDPVLKRKVAHYSNRTSGCTSTTGSSTRLHLRRSPIRLNDEMNINYVDAYLGYHNPVPLEMLSQVQHAQGRRVKNRRSGSDYDEFGLSQVTSEV